VNRCRAFSWEVISLAQRQGHAILRASRNISEIGKGLTGQLETMACGGVPAGHPGTFRGTGKSTGNSRLAIFQRHQI